MNKFFSTAISTWQQWLFAVVGIYFLFWTFRFVAQSAIAEGSACFGIAFLSFIYSNLSRFKRFRGLGFEAELWEDKQREAVELIERLKPIVSIYTQEIFDNRIMRGRFLTPQKWRGHWELFETITERHTELGQNIDFGDTKHMLDSFFAIDSVSKFGKSLIKGLSESLDEASQKVAIEHEYDPRTGNVGKDDEGFRARNLKITEMRKRELSNKATIAEQCNLPEAFLEWYSSQKKAIEDEFSVTVKDDEDALRKLRAFRDLYKIRPIVITEEVLRMVDD